MSRIKVVFFDLGSTLVYSKHPWPPIYAQADQALLGSLERAGITLDPTSLSTEPGSFIESYYRNRSADNIEKTMYGYLGENLSRNGYNAVQESIKREALRAMYAVTQQNWYLEEDAIPTLQSLLSSGYRLGVISNTSDDRNVHEIITRCGLDPFFEIVVTSAAQGIRKPDERIFQYALDQLGVLPPAAVMVGDLPGVDVLGAKNIGIFSIWISRRSAVTLPDPVVPDAIVKNLGEIPSIITSLT